MKALTLHQPWASLIACGAKTIETRARATRYRGPLLIHAGKRQMRRLWYRPGWREDQVTDNQRIADVLVDQLGCEPVEANDGWWTVDARRLPLGAVVAVAELVDCVSTGEPDDGGQIIFYGNTRELPDCPWVSVPAEMEDEVDIVEVDASEGPLGDFTPGRYAWLLDDIRPIDPPVPARGRLGLWSPDEETVRQVGEEVAR